jgi:hypothetical protein
MIWSVSVNSKELNMPRGGKRAGAGRKSAEGAQASPRVQIPVRVDPEIRRKLKLAAEHSGISLTKQAQLFLETALSWPQSEKDDPRDWRGKHLYALGRLFAYAAGRLEAVLGLSGPVSPGIRWSENPIAAQALREAVNIVLQKHIERMAHPLSPEQAAHAKAVGAEIARIVVYNLDTCNDRVPPGPPDPDDSIVAGDSFRFLPKVVEDFPWIRNASGRDRK